MFDLSEEVVRQVIFGMENQNHVYLLDTAEGRVVRSESTDEPVDLDRFYPDARYYPVPEWKSADGFNMMQGFVGELHDPQLRRDLSDILLSGKRVFRRFKDRLSENPEAQRRYYAFKFLEMRAVVAEWYNAIREIHGLDALELGSDEEIGDLVLTDIVIERPRPLPATMLEELDRQAFYEALSDADPEVTRFLYRRRIARLPAISHSRSVVLVASNPIGDLCGFLWVVDDRIENGTYLKTIEQLYVLSEYRRLGIAGALLDRFDKDEVVGNRATTVARVVGEADHRMEMFRRRGFAFLESSFVRS